jgi:hypothetical protein
LFIFDKNYNKTDAKGRADCIGSGPQTASEPRCRIGSIRGKEFIYAITRVLIKGQGRG